MGRAVRGHDVVCNLMGKPLTVQNYFEMNWAAVDGIEKIEDLDTKSEHVN
jgi:hypothetical protein